MANKKSHAQNVHPLLLSKKNEYLVVAQNERISKKNVWQFKKKMKAKKAMKNKQKKSPKD